jgi:GNAT superfamily N-acetyltransferase
MQGRGLGRKLMRSAMQFCRDAGHRHVTLTTFAGLDAARALYEAHGFRLTDEHVDSTWGVPVTEQCFDWTAH